MTPSRMLLRPGTLWTAIQQTTQLALDTGALQPIQTRAVPLDQEGIRFIARVAINPFTEEQDPLPHRQPGQLNGKHCDPFLPPDPDLLVAGISDTHLAVLNKYTVLPHHLLLVTRAFESQEQALTLADFAALWACMGEFDGLAFYNGGAVAGASQRHKHLQLVPLPLEEDGPPFPTAPLLDAANLPFGEPVIVPTLPFRHRAVGLDPERLAQQHDSAAAAVHQHYLSALDVLGIPPRPGEQGPRQSAPYNLLMTRHWMMVVPRWRERVDELSVNALGFAGTFFVKDEMTLRWLRRSGPVNVLKEI